MNNFMIAYNVELDKKTESGYIVRGEAVLVAEQFLKSRQFEFKTIVRKINDSSILHVRHFAKAEINVSEGLALIKVLKEEGARGTNITLLKGDPEETI